MIINGRCARFAMYDAPWKSAIWRDRTTVLTFGKYNNIWKYNNLQFWETAFLIFVWAETWANRLIWV